MSPRPTDEPPARFFVVYQREVTSPIIGRRTLEHREDLNTPAAIEMACEPAFEGGLLAALNREVGVVAAAIGQAHQIARHHRTTVALYERREITETTGPRDGARSWTWKTLLRAVQEPPT
jgi:hypothetical protein